MSDLYDYEFALWIDGEKSAPIELSGTQKVDLVRLLQRALSARQILENITSEQFGNIRESLWKMGFEMHEITRKPYCLEERIS